jgi:hypothetical protein
LRSEGWIRIDPDPLAAHIRYSPLGRTPTTDALNVSMVRRQKDGITMVQEQIEEAGQKALCRPLTHLIMHASSPECHPMHDLVNRINHKPDNTDPGMGETCLDSREIRVLAESSGISNL